MSGGQSGEGSSSAAPQASGSKRKEVHQVNESLYELHRPDGTPSMILLFFHGLQLGDDFSDAHLSTWTTADGTIWPREWLVEFFPGAHILSVSYRAAVGSWSGGGNDDLYIIVENLIYDLMQANIGQTQNCPIVLVGHCLGGLVIKQLCLESSKRIRKGKMAKPQTFLDNVRGIFYYGTPHHGSPFISTQPANVHDSPLLKYFRTLNAEAGRLNYEFDHLRRSYGNWSVHALGETLSTKSALFGDSVAVPEASSREGDTFNVVEADHISISKPKNQVDRRFYALKDLLHDIAVHSKKEAREREETHAKEARPQNFQYLPEHVVDIVAQVLEIKSKLETVRTLGLIGMGGVGKTTLAMAVFNNLGPTFEYSCFLRDVKLIQGNVDKVKDAIWEHMNYCGKEVEGRRNFSKLSGQRLLLVLDDISDRDGEVLSELVRDTALESRFITTSRQHDLLNGLEYIHEVPFLNESSAKRLFMEHAFPLQTAPSQFESISEAIVKKCDGLPLTLQVLGKFLQKKTNYEDWEQTLNALHNAEGVQNFDERLWGKLRLSYNGLGPTEQQMFLDATTFFSNDSWNLQEAKMAWRVAYETTSERLLWQTLVDMSLVYKVEEDEHIKVHEQLQSLGRRIALEATNYGRCRVLDRKAALEMLRSTEDSGKEIHALQFNKPRWDSSDRNGILLESNSLCKLKNLQFFEADVRIKFNKRRCFWLRKIKPASVPAKLVLLKCVGGDLFNPAIQTRLVILHLSGVKSIPSSIGRLTLLQRLEITHGSFEELPSSFGRLKSLQHLLFEDCHGLESLPESFGQLSALKHLKFWNCNNLHTLPESFGQLSALKHLTFYHCDNLHTLPESFRQLSALNHLVFFTCNNLHTLPESFGQLSALKYLVLRRFENLHTLPESFGQLSVLEHLEFERCGNLQTLPESFGQLSALKHLEFWNCNNLHTLPESFGQLSALNYLRFYHCDNLHTLPESFGQLSTLKHLKLECNNLHTLPDCFGQLSALNHLELECNNLHTLPESFRQLSALNYLRFYHCDNLHTLLESFGQLSALNHLAFWTCNNLHTLPESFGQLSALNHLAFWTCNNLHTLPESFGQLSALNHLAFWTCNNLHTLPESFGQLYALKHLEFSGNLPALPESFGQLSSLKHLEFCYCDNLHTLPESFGQLSSLKDLEFYCCDNLHTLPESFGQLSALNYLKFTTCDNLHALPESFGQLSALKHLEFERCGNLHTLPESFWQLFAVEHLEFKEFYNLPESFGQPTKLQCLQICADVEMSPNSLKDLTDLCDLEIGSHSTKSIADCISRLLSFHQPDVLSDYASLRWLDVCFHNDVLKPIPPPGHLWTVRKQDNIVKQLWMTLQVQDGGFCLKEISLDSLSDENLDLYNLDYLSDTW